MQQPKQIAVVAGATGRTGYHIVKELINSGYIVRIISRNRQSAKKALGPLFDQISDVLECDLYLEAQQLESRMNKGQYDSIVEQIFNKGDEGQKVSLFISALGKTQGKKEQCKYIEYFTMRLLIEICKKYQVDKFILVSSMLITRPYHIIAYILNQLVDNVLGWKLMAENYLRKSGLNYIIIRPGGLNGEKECQPTNFTIDQGDRLGGNINRATVGKIVVESIQDNTLPTKVTFECIATNEQKQQPFKWQAKQLMPDTQESQSQANHFQAKFRYNFLISSFAILIISYFMRGYFAIFFKSIYK